VKTKNCRNTTEPIPKVLFCFCENKKIVGINAEPTPKVLFYFCENKKIVGINAEPTPKALRDFRVY